MAYEGVRMTGEEAKEAREGERKTGRELGRPGKELETPENW